MELSKLGLLIVIGASILGIATVIIAYYKDHKAAKEAKKYNTVEFKCRKCKKYIFVHGIAVISRESEYCTCEEPEYYSKIETVERRM